MDMWAACCCCLLIDFVYVSSLYIWGTPADRQHPTTVRWRMVSVLATSCVAWTPAWWTHRQLVQTGNNVPGLVQLLGLQRDVKQLTASVQPLLITAILFTGPIMYRLHCWLEQRGQRQQRLPKQPSIHAIRDCLVAPITEEWCFRACMVPLLWMQGAKLSTIIFVTPLFFGVGHLHHIYFLVRQGWAMLQALQVVAFQLIYTTVFGWYATWVFCSTGRLVPAVAVHAFCNVMGVPPFGQMAANRHGRFLISLTLSGIVGFGCFMHWALFRLAGEGHKQDAAYASEAKKRL